MFANRYTALIDACVLAGALRRNLLLTLAGKLEEAVAAYREALKERTRERVPLDWATTQVNLGNAAKQSRHCDREARRAGQRDMLAR